HALTVVARVLRTPPQRERIQSGAEGSSGHRVEHAVDGVHAVEHGVDLEPAPLEVLFAVSVKTIRISDVPGVAAAEAQVLDREPQRVVDHLRLVARLPRVAEQVAPMTA